MGNEVVHEMQFKSHVRRQRHEMSIKVDEERKSGKMVDRLSDDEFGKRRMVCVSFKSVCRLLIFTLSNELMPDMVFLSFMFCLKVSRKT